MPTTEELHAEIATLRAELDALRKQISGRPRPSREPAGPSEPDDPGHAQSRRNLFRLAAAGLGGAGLAQLAVSPASAANGEAVVLGNTIQSATAPTGVSVIGSSATYGLAFTDNGADSVPVLTAIMGHARGFGGGTNFSTGVLGFAEQNAFYGVYGDSIRCGVKGQARGPADNGWPGVLGEGQGDGVAGVGRVGVHGHSATDVPASAGVRGTTTESNVPALRAATASGLLALDEAQPAPPSSGTYRRGDILNDSGGSGVWVCVAGGANGGAWRKIAGQASAGTYHAKNGVRAYDSRQTGGKVSSGQTRTISIPLSIVPARTTAVHYVLTAISTTGKGSLTAFRAGSTRPAVTSIVWWGKKQKHANSLVTEVNSARQLSIHASGGSTHFTIDVLGFYL